ncbi:MAG TPA: cysteine peptidase family C39 domain-containing protein [Vicinamibacterales bacterium]|nr:cysteine peptidase family C39 domain-containing protein [Vicinamibacterales bacterium]
MTRHRARVLPAAVILVMAAAVTSAASQVAQAPPAPAVSFLDVPFLPQTEALCGGAAAAMVMRYWGATGIQAETFSSLVDAAAGGIHGADLLRDLRTRGWDARSFAGDASLVGARLRDRQPVVALIEDRPGALHYVVVVAWHNGRVVLHDPARAPFRVLDEMAFDRAWQKTGRWTMLVLPGTAPGISAAPGSTVESSTPPSACEGLVAEAVRAVGSGDQPGALKMLEAAGTLCPDDPAPPRELAGVFALRGEWSEASRYSRIALKRHPGDEHAWRILATSSFVQGDTPSALMAWNHVGEPLIDIVNVRGLERTRYVAAQSSMRLQPGQVLSTRDFVAAGRRLSELPAAQGSRVLYRPLENGRAAVDAVVIERSRYPFSPAGIAAISVRALGGREMSASVANPTGGGDLVSASWRFWKHRPRVAASYAAPAPFGGILRADVSRDEQAYAVGTESPTREVRRGGGITLTDWSATGFRWSLGVGVDSWTERGRALTMTGSIDQRMLQDRVSLQGSASALAGGFGSWVLATSASARSSTPHEGTVWLASTGAEFTATNAPLALWPGAGTGDARAPLLRAHPLLDHGILKGDVFGRRLYYASAEARRWRPPLKRVLRLAPAAFIDAARADRRLREGRAWHVDAGVGLRVAVPGNGIARLDIAKGLRDGATVFSVGWTR